MFVFLTVPQPILNITAIQSYAHLAGMPFVLQCLVILDIPVDTNVGIAVMWQRNGVVLNDSDRIITSQQQQPPLMGEYNALLQFDTLSSTSDSGNYVCTAVVYPNGSKDYISQSTGSTSYTIAVIGT